MKGTDVRKRSRDAGSAAVEFALVLPILLVLVLGIVEFGRAYYVQTTLSGAARDGVRVMALFNDDDTARQVTRDSAPGLGLTDADISVTPTTCVATSTDPSATATVTVTHELELITGFISPQITLTGTGTMRCNG